MDKVRLGVPGIHHVRGYYDGYSFIYRDRLYALTQWDEASPWMLKKLDGSKQVVNTHRLHLDTAIEALEELLGPLSSQEPLSPAGATTPRGEAGVDEVDPSVPPWD
jgi:hypothetical protein